MTLSDSINRLKWRFEKNQNFKPNQKDVECLNFLIDFVIDNNEKHFNNNRLYAKLYMACLKATMEHYKCNIFQVTAQKAIHRFLAKPLSHHFERFADFLNTQCMYDVMDKNGELTDMISAGKSFSSEDVEANIKIMVSESLRKYNKC
ncbi:hypothetical protein [Pareuzebyella sediminis]|uniref:hypothetical protein n=1 Tax=Pareuzebyella sediminis TaxID=2607998 RepID=UPI0011EDDE17|nr:hypothetical protein [Pareuzebyella sediminis]